MAEGSREVGPGMHHQGKLGDSRGMMQNEILRVDQGCDYRQTEQLEVCVCGSGKMVYGRCW